MDGGRCRKKSVGRHELNKRVDHTKRLLAKLNKNSMGCYIKKVKKSKLIDRYEYRIRCLNSSLDADKT